MSGRNYHMRLDIKGALRNARHNPEALNYFTDDDGREMTPIQAFNALMEELQKGHKYMPVGKCDNFDPKEEGCKGHALPEKAAGI